MEPVPYKPNPLKYRYLLQNKYEIISNIDNACKIESPKRNVLGDFTMYKVNKEFEKF